ncbi:hypothetical protein EB73_21070 [Mycobacterium sp. SWH-M3]|nr:hypothetical protein EB73_21070 [Mycobacterium sp. SWH-M3]
MSRTKPPAGLSAPYLHETVVFENHLAGGPDQTGRTEIAYGPGMWTVAHRGYSGGRRLDVWGYRSRTAALRAAAQLALDCGLDESAEAVDRFAKGRYQWLIDRYNEQGPDWRILAVQVVNLITATGDFVVSSVEIRSSSYSQPGP